jgi:hypothetical protein
VCWDAYSDKEVQAFGVKATDPDVWAMRKKFQQQGLELTFMSSKIAAALPSTSTNGTARKQLSLKNVHLQNSDFSNIDFSHVDISGADFSTCQLTNAKLLPEKFDGSTFETSNWWDAAIINKALLQMLIDGAYPTKDQHFFAPPPRPTRLEYVSSVLALCHQVDLTCTEAHILYEEDETGLGSESRE